MDKYQKCNYLLQTAIPQQYIWHSVWIPHNGLYNGKNSSFILMTAIMLPLKVHFKKKRAICVNDIKCLNVFFHFGKLHLFGCNCNKKSCMIPHLFWTFPNQALVISMYWDPVTTQTGCTLSFVIKPSVALCCHKLYLPFSAIPPFPDQQNYASCGKNSHCLA